MPRRAFTPLPKILEIKTLFTYFTPHYAAGFYFGGEVHDFWELVYVRSGKIGISENDNIYEMHSGHIIFHKPFELHKLWADEECDLVIMTFTAEGEGLAALQRGVFDVNSFHPGAFEDLLHSISTVFTPRAGHIVPHINRSASPEDIQTAAIDFEKFLLSITKNSVVPHTRMHSRSADNYRRIIRAINDNIDLPLNIDMIADMCSMSTSNLKKTFYRYGGEGITKYITHLKLQKALRLLAEGLTISEISDRLSFSSQNYFSMVFKKEFGCPPSEYRV